MSDSINVRVTLDSYDVVHPSEKQTQVYVQIPEVGRASWLLDEDFYGRLKNEPWPHVIDSAHEEYQRRGVVSDSTSEAARKAIVDWLLLSEGADYDARYDAVQAAWEADQARQHPVARKLLKENEHLRARVAELESERHSTNEALDDAVQALRARPTQPSRFTATPAQVDAYLREILAEDTYLRFQQAIGEHALAEVVEDAGIVRASADNDGLYNADWREGWDDAIERVDPDLCGPCPSKLIEFPAESGGAS